MINLLSTSLDGGLMNGGLVVVTRAGALVVGGGRAGRLQILKINFMFQTFNLFELLEFDHF